MKLFHRTPRAGDVLAGGFSDNTTTRAIRHGVWFSDAPLDQQDGVKGWTVLTLTIPDAMLGEYEEDDGGRGYRYFVIPSEIANRFGPPTVYDDDYKGCNRESIERLVAGYREDGTDWSKSQADKLSTHLAFLDRYGLLSTDDD